MAPVRYLRGAVIMRKAIVSHHGHVFSTAGDAFAAAFPTVDNAAHAALDIQLGLLDAGWPGPHIKVRMGIHTGDARNGTATTSDRR